MKTKRQAAIMRARAHAYAKQRDLRDKLKSAVENAIDTNVPLAVAQWQRKEVMAEKLTRWLAGAEYPVECADLVRWIMSNYRAAFASYNPYIQAQAMKAATAAEEIINDEGSKIARQLVADMKAVQP